MVRPKKQIADLTKQLEDLIAQKAGLDSENKILADNNLYLNERFIEANEKNSKLTDSLSYLRTNTIPELEENLRQEQQNYTKAQEVHEREITSVLRNQDIAHVGANISTAVDEHYKTALQENLAHIKKRAAEHGTDSNWMPYGTSGVFAYFGDLGVQVRTLRCSLYEDGLTLDEKLEEGQRKQPQVVFSRGDLITVEEFMDSPIYERLKKQRAGKIDSVPVQQLPQGSLVITFKNNDDSSDSNRAYHNIIAFFVDAEKENAYGDMLRNDLRTLVTAGVIGAFENALGQEQYAMARKIADKYLTKETSTVFAPMIKDIAEKDPKAAGYFTNLQLAQ